MARTEYWPNNWCDTDDVYVTYVDTGYYLFNRRYPNDGIAISISMQRCTRCSPGGPHHIVNIPV